MSKQVDNKGDKDVQIDLISKNKETYKTETKVEAFEKLYSLEANVYENHVTGKAVTPVIFSPIKNVKVTTIYLQQLICLQKSKNLSVVQLRKYIPWHNG